MTGYGRWGRCGVILSIPLGRSNCPDNFIWHSDSRGLYTVRSGYWVAMEAKGLEGSSNAVVSKTWWGKLWSLKLPSKCCEGVESIWHSLWECPSAKEVWDSSVLWSKLRCSLAVSFAGLCLEFFEKGS
ncbi:hypothetical protein TIFTF001_026071 [Ficus carica]|uniref:Reverse transcriptase zinc-binding domain-containing protein n=1 Tax=Ficus carica TaxID=3494 RepID=A0AA88B1S8_FICCA|nr:hypothetical protein TIFTF001_026071 [Ficus carica]